MHLYCAIAERVLLTMKPESGIACQASISLGILTIQFRTIFFRFVYCLNAILFLTPMKRDILLI